MAEPPKVKKPKRMCHFDSKWEKEFPGIAASSKCKYMQVIYLVSLMSVSLFYLRDSNLGRCFQYASILMAISVFFVAQKMGGGQKSISPTRPFF